MMTNGISRIAAIVTTTSVLLAMLMSVVVWGLKLEGELNSVRNDVSELKARVGTGILPRAEERIRHLEQEMDEHKDEDHD